MKTTADAVLWLLWHGTAVVVVLGAAYLVVTGSALFSPIRQQTQIALSVDSKGGVTYVSGSLPNQNVCTQVRVKTNATNETTQILRFETEKTPLCSDDATTAITFLSSFPGRPQTIEATLDGKPLVVLEKTL
jgi:hypothetical protein